MVMFDAGKKGTVIITMPRSGSHLLGDIISVRAQQHGVNVNNLAEYFLNYNVDLSTAHAYFKSMIANLDNITGYQIIQLTDFTSKIWLLNYGQEFLKKYHVVTLKRKNQADHLMSKVILEKYHNIVSAHTTDKYDGGYFNLINQEPFSVDLDTVLQFKVESNLINLFDCACEVYYEDIVSMPEVGQSQYKKNPYPVTFNQLCNNFDEIKDFFND
jgi:hypothetical protein